MRRRSAAIAGIALLAGCATSEAPPRLLLGATHTLEDSGLLAELAAGFRAAHPQWALQAVVAGSGEVLELGRHGDVDVLLTHAPADEGRFVAEGHGRDRRQVMHNDFLILGPPGDPAGIRGEPDPAAALSRIAQAGSPFVSRGDDSGTHKRELSLWRDAGGRPEWNGYIEAGVGMADALRVADQRGAYILADRATWSVLRGGLSLEPALEGDPRLLNQYSVTLVTRAANPEGGVAFAAWLLGAEARRIIEGFGVDEAGQPLFVPDAG